MWNPDKSGRFLIFICIFYFLYFILMSSTRIIDCGLKDYQSVLNLQENALQSLLAGTGKDTIFITEHQPVITLGARDSANKLSKDPDTIKQSGIEIFQIRRGVK